jgi:phospholipid-binding lipoprotein MlaA
MLPLLGPSTIRDTAARGVDQFADPNQYLEDDSTRFMITAVEIVDLRAGLLELDAQLAQSYDRYAFVRNAWLQRREYKVRDGNVEDDAAFDEEALLNEEPAAAPPATPDTPPASQ